MDCLDRGYLVNKLIVLIPSEMCYRPVLHNARNYEKKVKAPLVHYKSVNRVSPLSTISGFQNFFEIEIENDFAHPITHHRNSISGISHLLLTRF